MPDFTSICAAVAFGLGIASYWHQRLVGPAIAALALGMLLIGK
jgi:hypothetical protein